MMKNSLIAIVAFFTVQQCTAQSISLDFPYFAGDAWVLQAFRGERMDTIASGALNQKGKTAILLPENYKNYTGMSRWMLAKGGGVDMILTGKENIAISCLHPDPAVGGISFNNTPENTYLRERYGEQDKILQRIEALQMAVSAYVGSTSKLLFVLDKELAEQKSAYVRLQQQTTEEKKYAARFSEIVNVTRGLGKTLWDDWQESANALSAFIINDMDINALYTSGHWQGILNQWL